MPYIIPLIADFKAYFFRDFPFGTDQTTTILDADIQRAINDAGFDINDALFPDQTTYTDAYLLLTAHNLVMNLRASAQGIAGQFSWLTGSKGVGSVSESQQIPDQIANDPYLAAFSKTNYGVKYLLRILPLLRGQIYSTPGATQA